MFIKHIRWGCIIFITILLFLVGASFGCQPAQEEKSSNLNTAVEDEKWNLDFATGFEFSMFVHKDIFPPFFDEINEKTNGRVVINDYFDGELFGHVEAIQAINQGTCDIAYGSIAYYAGFNPVFNYGSYWFLDDFVDSYNELFELTDQLLQKSNMKLLAFIPMSWNAIGSVYPITMPEDIKGKRIRGASGGEIAVIESYGGIPASLSPGEMHDALHKGAIDGVLSVLAGLETMHLQEVITDVTYPTGIPVYAVAMNLNLWESLPNDIQQVFKQASENLFNSSVELGREWDEKTLKFFEDEGMKIHKLTEEEYDIWREATEPAYNSFISLCEEAGEGDTAKRLIELLKK